MNKSITYYQGKRSEIIQFLPNEYTKVLEIGCGQGDFRSNLSAQCECWGIEPVKNISKIAEKKLYKVLVGTYEVVFEQLPDNYFDLVILNDVIEHMVDYNHFFSTIKEKLKNNAYLVGSIPNVRSLNNLIELLFMKNWHYKHGGILDYSHLRFFTEKSIRHLFNARGFKIEYLTGINVIKKIIIPPKKFLRSVLIKKFLRYSLICILGRDIRYLQFGFRVKYSRSSK
jgi:2-polyprenyl-3-methyl-5-hydroxy-6-metoxy-1,4-benzoquinol methylase